MKLIYHTLLDDRVIVHHSDWRVLMEHAWRRYRIKRYWFTFVDAASLRPVLEPLVK